MNTIAKKIIKAGIVSLSVFSFTACQKATGMGNAKVLSVSTGENVKLAGGQLASNTVDNEQTQEVSINEIETITVPVESFEVPENFSEDWLLTNTYPGDNVGWDVDLSGLIDAEYSHSTLIVYLNDGTCDEEKTAFLAKYNAEVIYDYNIISGMAIKLSEEKTTEELDLLIAEMEKESIVLSVQKDYVYSLTDEKITLGMD